MQNKNLIKLQKKLFIFLKIVFKIIAISYISEFTASLCRDAGESAVARHLETAGKLVILGISLPVITAFFETVINAIP